MKFKSYYCIRWMTNSCNARSPVILCQVVHKKFSHSQFSQFGSRKGRNDSNLFDPSGSISLNTRDNAQALRLSLVDSIHCSDAMNLHGHTETGLNLNGSNSGAGKHVWPLDESRAFGMHAEGWAVHHDWNLEQSVFVKSYFEPPRSSHFDPFFAQCKNDRNNLNELWTKIVEFKTQGNFTLDFKPQVWHIWSHGPLFTSRCAGAFGENVNDSVLIGPSFVPTYRNLSKHPLSAWHTRTHFPRETLA